MYSMKEEFLTKSELTHIKKNISIEKPLPTRFMTVIAKELFKNQNRSQDVEPKNKKPKLVDNSNNIVKSNSELSITSSTSSTSTSGPVSPKSIDIDPNSLLSLPTPIKPIMPLKGMRCQYWPRCARGATCRFVHPTEVCKLYPNCPNQSNRCLFIHPGGIITQCKFGTKCHNKSCRFAHEDQEGLYVEERGIKRKLSETIENIKTKIPYRCRNGLFCKKVDCAFLHPGHEPVQCKFGSYCNRLDCYYNHPNPQYDEHGRPLSYRDNPIFLNAKGYHNNMRQRVYLYIEQYEMELNKLEMDCSDDEEISYILKK